MTLPRFCFFALLPAWGGFCSALPAAEAPWTQPRTMDQFSGLLNRSPFTLPTAEESSPLAERFALTGAYALDGEQVVFVVDKNTQVREKVTIEPNKLGLRLVEYLPDPDPRKMRATIRLGEQTATVTFQESVVQAPQNPTALPPNGMPDNNGRTPNQNVIPQFGMIPSATTPGAKPGATPPISRRVIRRTIISGTSAPSP